MAQPLLNVTELDFDQIKANLKAYFTRQDSPIKDWNFDGSGLNMLLEVLAYNTHYNAVLAHLNLNESFIDTAQLRSSVISQAKLLGYIPASIGAATVDVVAVFSSSGSPTATSSVIIPSGTKFTGTGPRGSFTFVTQDTYTAPYVTTLSSYVSPTLPLIQGVARSQTYQVDNTLASQRFTLDDPSADIGTLRVSVFANQNSSTPEQFLPLSSFIANAGGDVANVQGTSAIYHLSLNSTGTYEVTFGDGVLGKPLNNLNIVQLNYISTEGMAANDITDFVYADSTLTSTDSILTSTVSVTVHEDSEYSAGGHAPESIDSIRINAPASLISQNRAVTANDYISLLQRQNPEITSVNVWGGEDEVIYDPINAAQYAGKVFISYVSNATLDSADVIAALRPFKVMSVSPRYYAPDYVNLTLGINVKYNPNLTTKGALDLGAQVDAITAEYNSSSLQNFTGVFRHSKLLRDIDTSDPAILNSDIQVSFYKDYTARNLSAASDVATYGIAALPNGLVTTFGNALNGTVSQVGSMVTSSAFTLSSALLPTQAATAVYGTCSTNSTTVTLVSSPGTAASGNKLMHPYLVKGAAVSASGVWAHGTSSITAINNSGSYTILTINNTASGELTSSSVLSIFPPAGYYYLKDGPDPTSTTSRRLFMSTISNAVVIDPKYVMTGSDIHIGTVYPASGKVELYSYLSGTATSQPVSGLSLLDNSYAGAGGQWCQNQFTNCLLYVTAGQGAGNAAVITTNSTNALYWASPSILLDASSQYMIIRSSIDTTATTSTSVRVYSRPASNDVAPSRHQLIKIDVDNTTATATADSFAQAGVLGAASYTTFARDPS